MNQVATAFDGLFREAAKLKIIGVGKNRRIARPG